MSKITINATYGPNLKRTINGKSVYVMSIWANDIVIAEEYFDSFPLLLANVNEMKFKHAKIVEQYTKEASQSNNED